MRVDDYTTLKAISESSGIKYHTLYRMMDEAPRTRRTKIGTVIFINKKQATKLVEKVRNAH